MKHYFDRNASLAPFKRGDRVLLYWPRRVVGISPKLTSPWDGPYVILDIINDCNARIQNIAKPKKIMIVHMERLMYCPNSPENDGDPQHADIRSAWITYINN